MTKIDKLKKSIFSTLLCIRFPFLKYNGVKNRFWQSTCWYYHVEYGWRKIALQMFEEIRCAIKDNMLPNDVLSIYDMKEKYGCLDIGYTLSIKCDVIDKIILKYEYISFRTCIVCGAPAYGVTKGWVYPVCKRCKSNGVQVDEFGTLDNPWYDSYWNG